jgi:uncharacterized protein (UPF0548 family)
MSSGGAGVSGRPRSFADLRELRLNFDPAQREQFTPPNGWHVDECRQPLPAEPPGPPLPEGSWEVARGLMGAYEFADPAIVRASFDTRAPLERRDMLLVVRFWGLRFPVGVRVGGVREETLSDAEGRRARVWGWCYRTLEGHFEMGQMDYEVWKWLDTGAVEFRIHAFSRPAPVANPLVRFGFRLVGRREQLRFYRRCCQRMAQLTAAALARRKNTDREGR